MSAEEEFIAAETAYLRQRAIAGDSRPEPAGSAHLTDPHVEVGEQALEASLRPERLAELIGQTRVREQL